MGEFIGPVENAPRNSYAFQFRRTSRLLGRYYNGKLYERGAIRSTQYDVLATLATQHHKNNSIIDVADLLGMAPSTLSRSLSRLERDGFVEFRYGADARRKFPKITGNGRAALERARAAIVLVPQARLATRFEKVFPDIRTRLERVNHLLRVQIHDEWLVRLYPFLRDHYVSQWYGITYMDAVFRGLEEDARYWEKQRARGYTSRDPPPSS